MSDLREHGVTRRAAFKAAGLGLGGAAIAAAGAARAEGVDVDARGGLGYHETDHVRTFYQSCKF